MLQLLSNALSAGIYGKSLNYSQYFHPFMYLLVTFQFVVK